MKAYPTLIEYRDEIQQRRMAEASRRAAANGLSDSNDMSPREDANREVMDELKAGKVTLGAIPHNGHHEGEPTIKDWKWWAARLTPRQRSEMFITGLWTRPPTEEFDFSRFIVIRADEAAATELVPVSAAPAAPERDIRSVQANKPHPRRGRRQRSGAKHDTPALDKMETLIREQGCPSPHAAATRVYDEYRELIAPGGSERKQDIDRLGRKYRKSNRARQPTALE
jgi:hypothetical protein